MAGEGQTLNNLGIIYWNLAQFPKAVEYYDKSLVIRRKIGDVAGEGQTLNNLGIIYWNWGRYQEAVQYYEKALEIRKKIGDIAGIGQTLNNLGLISWNAGEYAKAADYYEKSLEIRRKTGEVQGEGLALNNLGNVYKDWGQYGKAIDYYQKSLDIFEKIGDAKDEATSLNNLGIVYKDWGQYAKAVEYYEKSLGIKRRIGDTLGEAQTVTNLGVVYREWGQYDKALASFQSGLEIYKKIGVSTAWANDNIGNLYLDTGDIQKAEPFVKAANYYTSRGRLSLAKADYPSAKENYEGLLKSAEKTGNSDNLFTAFTGLGKVYESMEDYKQSEQYYEKGMKLTEEIRSGLLPSERKNFFEVKINGFQRSEPAQGLTRVRMKLNEAAGSIDSSEVTRARGFSDNIALTAGPGSSSVPDQILRKEDELVSKVASLKKQLAKTDKEKALSTYENLNTQVRTAEAELNLFIDMLWEQYRRYATVKYPRPVTLKDSALKPEEWVVIFDVSSEGVGVKLIKGKEIADTYYTKWKSVDLEAAVKKFRESFEQAKLKAFDPELGKTLYKRLLLAMLAQVPEGAPIIIIPDGALAVLPFEALVVSGKATWQEDGNRPYPEGLTYLGDVYPISYYQSITALSLARDFRGKDNPGARTMVIADPVFDANDPRLKVATVQERQRLLASLPETLMSIKTQTGVAFPRLALTTDLAESLKRLGPDKTDLLTGLQANKSVLFEKPLMNYGSIVFATHGYFGKDIPGVQEPVLAMTMLGGPKGQDGFLRMSEVMKMRLNANVVALTACQTGLGTNLSGEGVMSMGRAFQYAGAKSILMSLWSVSESGSVLLVQKFFEHLDSGKTKLEALKLAREDVRNAGYRHPFYWAPFILVGEAN